MDEMVGWHHCLNGHKFNQAPEMVKYREAMGPQRVGHDWAIEPQQEEELCRN